MLMIQVRRAAGSLVGRQADGAGFHNVLSTAWRHSCHLFCKRRWRAISGRNSLCSVKNALKSVSVPG